MLAQTPLDDAERLAAALAEAQKECARGNGALFSKATVDKLLQVLDDDNPSVSAKRTAYDLLSCVSDGDELTRLRVLERACRDLKVTGMPDLVIAAMNVIHAQPQNNVLSFWLAPGADKTVCTLLGAEAATSVRERAAHVFVPAAFTAWLLCETFVVTTSPQASFSDQHRKRQGVQDKVVEVLKAVLINAEDVLDGVAAAAHTSLRGLLEAYIMSSRTNTGPSLPIDVPCAQSHAGSAFVSNLCRRLSPRLIVILRRSELLPPLARADVLALVSHTLCFLLHESSGTGSITEAPLTIHVDALTTLKDLTVPDLAVYVIKHWFQPALSDMSQYIRVSALHCLDQLLYAAVGRQAEADGIVIPAVDMFMRPSHVHYKAIALDMLAQQLSEACLDVALALLEHLPVTDPDVSFLRSLSRRLSGRDVPEHLQGHIRLSSDASDGMGSVVPSASTFSSRSGIPASPDVHGSPALIRPTADIAGSTTSIQRISVAAAGGGSSSQLPVSAAVSSRLQASGWPSTVGRHLGRDAVTLPSKSTSAGPSTLKQRESKAGTVSRSKSAIASSSSARTSHLLPSDSTASDDPVLTMVAPPSPSLCGFDLTECTPIIISGGSDPLLIEVQHGVSQLNHRMHLFVHVTNMTRIALDGVKLTLGLVGPLTFIYADPTSTNAIPGMFQSSFAIAGPFAPGSTALWEAPITVIGLSACSIVIKASISTNSSQDDSARAIDDDAVDEWGSDANVLINPEPATLTLAFKPYDVPLSSFLIAHPVAADANGMVMFLGVWEKLAHAHFVDCVSDHFGPESPKRESSWLTQHLSTRGLYTVPWPSALGRVQQAFLAKDWAGNAIAITLIAAVVSTDEPAAHQVSQVQPEDNIDTSTASVPSVFTLPKRSFSGPPPVPSVRAGPAHAAPAPAPPAAEKDDLLGLFDVFAPTAQPPAASGASVGLYPFQTPIKGARSPLGSRSARRIATPAPPRGQFTWRARIEIRCESSTSLAAFSSGMHAWAAEFSGGCLHVLRHFEQAPPADVRCTHEAAHILQAGLMSACGIASEPVSAPAAVDSSVHPSAHVFATPPRRASDPFSSMFGAKPAPPTPSDPAHALAALFPGFSIRTAP